MAENFVMFANKVLDAVKKGKKLPPKDIKTLDRILTNDRKRTNVLAAGLVSALKISATPKDTAKISSLFEKAEGRIAEDRSPFTKGEAELLRKILAGAGVSEKTSSWVSKHVDEMLAREIQEFIAGRSIERGFVPTKKSLSLKITKNQKESDESQTLYR
jgi:hypothetical protein